MGKHVRKSSRTQRRREATLRRLVEQGADDDRIFDAAIEVRKARAAALRARRSRAEPFSRLHRLAWLDREIENARQTPLLSILAEFGYRHAVRVAGRSDREESLLLGCETGVTPLEVYADALEEAGDATSTGVRWLAARGRFPVRLPSGGGRHSAEDWFWLAPDSVLATVGSSALLPEWIVLELAEVGRRWRRDVYFTTYGDAIDAAAMVVSNTRFVSDDTLLATLDTFEG